MSVCKQCGLEWTPRVANPRACPGCKRYDWNEPKKGVAKVAVRPPLTPRVEVLSGKTEQAKSTGEGRAVEVARGHVRLPKGSGGVGATVVGVENRDERRVPEPRSGANVGDTGREVGGDEETLAPDDFIPESARKGHKCPRCEKSNTVTPWGPGQMRCSACGVNFGV